MKQDQGSFNDPLSQCIRIITKPICLGSCCLKAPDHGCGAKLHRALRERAVKHTLLTAAREGLKWLQDRGESAPRVKYLT